jgi:hypothetical protein
MGLFHVVINERDLRRRDSSRGVSSIGAFERRLRKLTFTRIAAQSAVRVDARHHRIVTLLLERLTVNAIAPSLIVHS